MQTALPTLSANLFMYHVYSERDHGTKGGMLLSKSKGSRNCNKYAGKMAQPLRVLTVLPEDLNSVTAL